MIHRPPRSTLFPTRRSSDLDRTGSQHRPQTPQYRHHIPHPTTSGSTEPAHEAPAPDWSQLFLANEQTLPKNIPDRKSTRLNSSHANISYAVFCLKKKKKTNR